MWWTLPVLGVLAASALAVPWVLIGATTRRSSRADPGSDGPRRPPPDDGVRKLPPRDPDPDA